MEEMAEDPMVKAAEDMYNGANIGGPFKPIGERPYGVTILAVLWILDGLVSLVLGLLGGSPLSTIGASILGASALGTSTLALLLILVGIIDLILGLALFTGKNWARIFAMIGAVIGLFDIPIGTILGIIILWYLTRQNIKEFFGK